MKDGTHNFKQVLPTPPGVCSTARGERRVMDKARLCPFSSMPNTNETPSGQQLQLRPTKPV